MPSKGPLPGQKAASEAALELELRLESAVMAAAAEAIPEPAEVLGSVPKDGCAFPGDVAAVPADCDWPCPVAGVVEVVTRDLAA